MSEIVRTTGRRMSQSLQDAIDGLPSRELSIRAFRELAAEGGRLGGLYEALALELRLADLREQDTLHQLASDLSAPDPLDPPLPQATGGAVFFDPETGEFTDLRPTSTRSDDDA